MLEFEKKIILNKAEYIFLKQLLKPSEITTQINYYYDTDSFEMNRNGITCRIREKNGEFKTVIKEHQKEWQDCSIENLCLQSTIYNDSFFKSMGLICQGVLTTNRIISTFDSVLVMLDKNSYLGIIDYELEIEYYSGFEAEASTILSNIASQMYDSHIIVDEHSFFERVNKRKCKAERFFLKKHSDS